MSYSNFSKAIALFLGVFVMSFSVGYLIFAWTEPTAVPPSCTVGDPGCDTPLTSGANYEEKIGPLVVNRGGAATGFIVENGNVGIGTLSPAAELDIRGSTRIGSGAAQVDRVLCWTSNNTIGYCSSGVDGSGGCTCNEIN